MKRREFNAALGAIGAIAALGPAAARAAEEDWSKVVEAAKKEGRVVIYSSHVGVPYHPEIGKLFEKKYGIAVEVLDARASEMRERIRTELATGRVNGDLSHNGGSTNTLMARQGLLQPHGYMPNLQRLAPQFVRQGIQVPVFVQSYGIAVNPKLVPEAERPKSWFDVTDPKWKGKILSDDMRALGGGSALFGVTYDALGREFHEKLAKQELHFSRSIRENPRRVARGEFAIYIPFSLSDVLIHKGLPLVPITPKEGNPYITYDVAVLKDAPHPNAARLLADFFLTEEAQMVYVKSGRSPTITGLEGRVPAELDEIVNAKLMGTVNPDRQEELLQIAKEIYR